MTVLSLQTVLSAVVLLAGDARPRADDAVGQAAAAAAPRPALPAARDRDATPPPAKPAREADRQTGLGGDQGVARPLTPGAAIDALPMPFRQPGPSVAPLWPAQADRTLLMPANPFPVVPPGATALRQAAVYGMQVGPAAAVGGVGGERAFASYQPTSPISPYASLYARPTRGVNNYNAYVRPQLEQRAFNQQVDTSFRTLETNKTAEQEAARRSFDQLYMTGPGASGATFMKLQPYYPSYPSSR